MKEEQIQELAPHVRRFAAETAEIAADTLVTFWESSDRVDNEGFCKDKYGNHITVTVIIEKVDKEGVN